MPPILPARSAIRRPGRGRARVLQSAPLHFSSSLPRHHRIVYPKRSGRGGRRVCEPLRGSGMWRRMGGAPRAEPQLAHGERE